MRQMTLYIYGYEDKNIRGVLYAPEYGVEREFSNLTQLLFLMDDLLKTGRQSVRAHLVSWRTRPRLRMGLGDRGRGQSPIAVFEIHEFKRNGYLWQGRISWMETGEELVFRSALELIKILDSALCE